MIEHLLAVLAPFAVKLIVEDQSWQGPRPNPNLKFEYGSQPPNFLNPFPIMYVEEEDAVRLVIMNQTNGNKYNSLLYIFIFWGFCTFFI